MISANKPIVVAMDCTHKISKEKKLINAMFKIGDDLR